MKKNQQGFGTVGVLVLVFIIGSIGAVGWLIYDRQNNKANNDSQITQNIAEQEPADGKNEDGHIDTLIHEVDIKMQTAEDISKLPDYTPTSFKAYMLDILKNNKFYYNNIDGVETIAQYHIDKISQVNIVGGQVPVDKNGDGHAGGAPVIWVLTPKGTWDQETLNGPVCTSKNGGLIFEEFVEECYTDSNSTTPVKNPNGSITSINE